MKKQTDSACRISGVADSVSGVGCRPLLGHSIPNLQFSIFNLQSSILSLLLLAGTASAATDYYVATTGSDTGANDGLSWAAPLLTISNGVAKATAAGAGSTVTVSNGTYAITAQITISAAITVQSFGNGVTGGMANAAATIVRYTPATRSGVFSITANANLQGFTIQEGKGVNSVYINGGGVYMNNGVVRDCIIQYNYGDSLRGGGVYMDGGLVRDCLIRSNGNADRTMGSGVYINSGGTVSNCVISGNYAANGAVGGGGVYMAAGTVVACQINDNSCGASYSGGGVQMGGGTLRNCLIARNTTAGTGGGVYVSGGTIESCTIFANSAGSSGGGGIYRASSGNAGTIRNCIVVNNTSTHATYQNTYSGTTTWNNNCTTNPVVAGTGCISGDPLFRDTAEGNFQLSTGSPCIDTGQDQDWMTGATDMSGNPRQQDIPSIGTASVDMGAYEYNAALTCDFLASPRALIAAPFTYQSYGPAPFTVQFTGWADGTNLTGLVYRWDFEGNNNWTDWVSYNTTSHVYNTPGVYNPKLQVTNSAAEVAEKIKSAYVSAGNTHYVCMNSPGALAPYTSWATAASNNIQAAINSANMNGDMVVISNGTYGISSQITVAPSRIAIRSYGGGVYGGLANAANTVVYRAGGTIRIFYVTGTDCEIQGLTIQGGVGNISGIPPAQNYGAGVLMYSGSGMLRDCIVQNNNGDNLTGCGVWMNGGTISNCIIRWNSCGQNIQGGGVYASAGQILYSQIYGNSHANGGGVYATGAGVLIRNCLIRNNTVWGNGGGVYGGTVESCTIVTNYASGGSSVGGGTYNSTVTDSIVFKNRTGGGSSPNYSGGTYTYSCTEPALGGNNVSAVTFVDFNGGDYRIKACPAVDSGTTLSWMTGALDLAGGPRIINSIVDMGAYEYAPGALECGFGANVTTVLTPANVVFTATVVGSNLTSLAYAWDFGDGNTANLAGLNVVTNLYSIPGAFTVKLTVTNGVGEVAAATNVNFITAWGANAYVWTNSPSPTAPYATWATAARLIGTAVATAPAGVTLWTTNGTYNEAGEIVVNKGVTVRSVEGNLSGASNTIVRASVGFSYRLFSLSDANAVLQGLTIQDTALAANGCGVNMSAGLVRDCIIRNNGFCDNHLGSGVYMSGGTVSNCVVKENGNGAGVDGSGIYATGGQILYCQILDNVQGALGYNAIGGGGVYASGGVLIRNCLIARNRSLRGNGSGVYLVSGTIESCTIVSNRATDTTSAGVGDGGGIYRVSGTAGTVNNSIVYFNTASASAYSNFYTTVTTGIGYTCTTNPVVAGTGCIPDAPLFFNPDAGDFSLKKTSLCIDAGLNQTWMTGATDLAGNNRLIKGNKAGVVIVDMGAYETFVPARGTVIVMW